MAILIPEPDINGSARASIKESAARHADAGRLLADVNYHLDMPLLQNLQEEPLLAAFASAVKNMGALEHAELFAYLQWHPSESRADEYGDEAPYDSEPGVHRLGVRYFKCGNDDDDDGDLRKGQVQAVVQWQVGD